MSAPDSIEFNIKDDWIRICDKFDKILLRANKINKPRPVADTARDKTQETRIEGFIRIRPSRIWELV